MRFEVKEVEPDKNDIHDGKWRIYDNNSDTYHPQGYRTLDGASAACETRNALEKLYGRTEESAKQHLNNLGYSMRVVKRDSEWIKPTRVQTHSGTDYNPRRINVVVVDGLVTYFDYVG